MIVFGHRGYSGRNRTENTLAAFQETLHKGGDGIEFDLHLSKDDELVVVHDHRLHRVAGDAHHVHELTAFELCQIPLRHGGRVPTLHDVTSTIPAPALFDMEVKDRSAVFPLILKLKTSAALRERTIVSSFLPSVLQSIRVACPDIRTILLFRRWPLPLQKRTFWHRAVRANAWAVGFPLPSLNAKRVSACRDAGFAVATWDIRGTVREALKAAKLEPDVAIVKCVDVLKMPKSYYEALEAKRRTPVMKQKIRD